MTATGIESSNRARSGSAARADNRARSGIHPAIRLEGVSKRYGSVVALDTVDLEIHSGEFFTLLGPSGSGKSTLLQLLAGFEAPTTGRIFLGGEDVTDLAANRRPTNTVFQSLALFPHMTVARNVEYGLKIARVPAAERAERRQAMLSVVGLQGLDDRAVHQLSGGQRQRVALARALVLEPTVLLLDEPLTGLDEKLRQQMQVEIKRLHSRLNATFLSVTHNQEEALSMSDRIAVLRDGVIEQLGTPREIYEQPVSLFVADFMGAENQIRPQSPVSLVQSERTAAGVTCARFLLDTAMITSLVPDHVDVDRPVVAVIRPESIRIGDAADAMENRLTATVLERTYKGRDATVEVALDDGQRLKLIDWEAAEGGVRVGDRISVGWALDAMRLLPARKHGESRQGGG